MVGRLVAVLAVLLAGSSAAADGIRAVVVEEDDTSVEVWIAVPPSMQPDSLEVQLAGQVVTVRGRDQAGQPLRSALLRLRGPVVEEGAAARWAGDWLAITLRKHEPAAAR